MILTPSLTSIQGLLKVYDPKSGEVFVDKKNAIHMDRKQPSSHEQPRTTDRGDEQLHHRQRWPASQLLCEPAASQS